MYIYICIYVYMYMWIHIHTYVYCTCIHISNINNRSILCVYIYVYYYTVNQNIVFTNKHLSRPFRQGQACSEPVAKASLDWSQMPRIVDAFQVPVCTFSLEIREKCCGVNSYYPKNPYGNTRPSEWRSPGPKNRWVWHPRTSQGFLG